MQVSLGLAVAYLATSVYAGGYQGCLERVLLYYAYQIDGLNPPADQTLGFRCKRWDSKAGCVNNVWEPCTSKANKGGRCTFNELMYHMGKVGPGDKLVGPPGANQNTISPNIEETAKLVYAHHTTPPNKKVPNFPPYKAMKNADNDFIKYNEKLGTVVNDARRAHGTASNKHLWDGFDATLDKIHTARTGDHGPFLIRAAQEKLGKNLGFDIKLRQLGINPISVPPAQWETVDWAATSQAAKAKGIPDVDKKIRDFRYDWYKGPKKVQAAADHYAVFKSYKRLNDQRLSCR
ncbi:hypothetical protein ACCO45_012642 [Purpureocillium lilacinum]